MTRAALTNNKTDAIMKFIRCTCENLANPVKIVAGIVERNQSLPVVSNILVEQKDAGVRFTTTDLDIQIQTTSPVGVEGVQTACTISAQKLNEILNSFKTQDALELEIDDDNRVTLSSKNSQFNLQTLSVRDFPVITGNDWLTDFTIEAKTLRYLLAMTSFAMANKDIRYFLNGVLMIVDNGLIKCVATDTHRLSYCDATVEGATAVEKPIKATIPRKTVRELLRILPEDDTPVQVRLSSTQCAFHFDNVEFLSKLVDGQFPDYEKVMPNLEINAQAVSINREDLITALRRVQILTNEKFHGVRWLLSKNQLLIQGSNSEQEEANQVIDIDWSWGDLDIGFNVIYLLDVLTSLKNTEVVFHFAATPKSVLITMPDSMNFQYVIMPMRI